MMFLTDDDREALVTFLSRQYLPANVVPIVRALSAPPALERWDLQDTGLGPALVPCEQGRFIRLTEEKVCR